MRKALIDAAQSLNCSQSDLAFVQEIVCRSKTSFASGMRVLPPARRYGMYALYSFCRIVDDIADDGGDTPTRLKLLQQWRDKIASIYTGQTADEVERVLLATIRKFDLRQEDFIAVIDGMQMDAEQTIVAPDEATLDRYCDCVASAVGRLAVRIFGDSSAQADQVAYHLGRALQLTNILRDLKEDAKRGRLYLPKELLARFHLPADSSACIQNPALHDVCQILAMRAEDHFRLARQFIKRCNAKAMRPAKVMAVTYSFLLRKQIKVGWHPPLKRVSLNTGEKLIIGFIGLVI